MSGNGTHDLFLLFLFDFFFFAEFRLIEEGVLEGVLQERIDENLTIDESVEKMLQLMAYDFTEEVLTASHELALHRGDDPSVDSNDVATYLWNQWGMRIPGYRSETRERKEEMTKDPPMAHRQR